MAQGDRVLEAQRLFGRSLIDPGFRAELRRRGVGHDDHDVVVALDDTTIGDVVRQVFRHCTPPTLVAIRRDRHPHGFVFLFFTPDLGGARPGGADKIHLNASIGALYDSLVQAGEGGRVVELIDGIGYDVDTAFPQPPDRPVPVGVG